MRRILFSQGFALHAIYIYLTFRASETRVFSNLIFDNLLKFLKILKTHFCLNFTILQLFLKFHYNLSHRSIKGM